jgi:xanthine dehydrogenase YagR molybdenum-binding subunit
MMETTAMGTQIGIGSPLSRVDGIVKVTGAARYAAEYPADDLLHAVVVSSAITRGKITGIDEAAARAVPGVVEIITHANRPSLAWFDRSYKDDVAVPGSPFRALYDDAILFNGQPVAVVVATSFEAARHAASLVEIGYAAAAHNTSLAVALPDKFMPKKTRLGFQKPKSRGDAEAALADAPVRVTGDWRKAVEHHNPMEMHASTVAWEGDGRITVYDKTQGAQNVQAYLASIFGLNKQNVRVLNPFVGGAFGSGLRPQYNVYLAVLAATMLKRSVRLVLTRRQMFTHSHRPECTQSIALGCDSAGKLLAIVNDATTATSRFENYMENVTNWGTMAYACDNAAPAYHIAPIDTATPGDMRAPGAATGMTLFEMAMDELAYAAAIDPLTLRLVNYTDKDEMHDKPYTSKALREAYAQGAAAFGWERRNPAPRSMRDGSELVGWGMATGIWDAYFFKTSASAKLGINGNLEVACATADIGTGTYTIMTQIAAGVLGLPTGQIHACLGDSDLPTAPVEGGSWGAASTGAAVQLACEAIQKQLAKAAAKVDGKPLGTTDVDDIVFADAAMCRKGGTGPSVTYADAMRAADVEMLEAEETAGPGPLDLLSMVRKARNTHSAIFAEVKIDEQLGVIRVTRIVIAVAAGRIINPKTARSQILGGVVWGISAALHEETFTDHRLGRIMNHSLAEYHLPVNADIGDIEVIFVDEPDPEVTPLGVKGLGEIGVVATAAAVANAIFHATGKRQRSLPITIDKLLDLADDR